MVGGPGRSHPALLVELRKPEIDQAERDKVLEQVWKLVSKANETNPFQGRVLKSLILILSPEKPLPRANKGTVQRAAVVQIFRQELSELYKAAEEST